MPAPIPFAVATANRSGTFQTAPLNYPGGYSRIYFELDIPITSQYEDTTNGFTATLLVDGDASAATWTGGRVVARDGVTIDPPPAFEWDLTRVAVGAVLQVRMALTRAMKVGIQAGVIA
jgi:hypothetical protein